MQPKFIVSLTFRGFSCSPEHVESLVGSPASLLVVKGNSRRPGQTPFIRSAAGWSMNFSEAEQLSDTIPALLKSLGGSEHLAIIKNAVNPDFLDVDVAMWFLDSEQQEGGSFTTDTLQMLSNIGATLSFGFYSRASQANPSATERDC